MRDQNCPETQKRPTKAKSLKPIMKQAIEQAINTAHASYYSNTSMKLASAIEAVCI